MEGTVVALVVAILISLLGAPRREINMSIEVLLIVTLLGAPVLETLIFQAFPVWIARLCKAKFSTQVISSVVPFIAIHAPGGIGAAIVAGLVGGFYIAFTYVHWREPGRWTAFWVTAVSHAIRNSIAILLALALGEI